MSVIEGLADWGSCTSCSLQDIKDLDSRGVPGGYIASNVFVQAAQSQGDSLGFHPKSVFVSHPIQDRSDEELRALADRAFSAVYALVCSSSTDA